MSALGDRIHFYIDGELASGLLAKYYRGGYTGSLFDTADPLRSPDPNRFTAEDFAAVAMLSVPLSGRSVAGLLDKEEQLAGLLSEVESGVDLADASDDVIEALFAVQSELDEVVGIGHVTRSKLLAHKRPRLVPIRDWHVLKALVGRGSGSFTRPLRHALASDRSIARRLLHIQRLVEIPEISTLRALDVVVWMATHGDSQVSDRGRPDTSGVGTSVNLGSIVAPKDAPRCWQ